MRNTKVSVGLPVYNGQKYLAQAVESFLAQTMGDLELIICDNASTDATEQLCRDFAARDSRVRYHRNPENIGANANFNRVALLARGQYFKWAAADDYVAPRYLEQCVKQLDANPSSALCHTQTNLIDLNGELITTENPPSREHHDPPRNLSSPNPVIRFHDVLLRTRWCFEIFGVVRREQLLSTGLQGKYYGSDKVVLAMLALQGPFWEVPEALFFRRCHPAQSTSIASAKARAVWSDPTNVRTKFVFPQWSCFRGYARGLRAVPLFPLERLACDVVLARYVLQFRKMGGLAENMISGMHSSRGSTDNAVVKKNLSERSTWRNAMDRDAEQLNADDARSLHDLN